ncbi:MAG TPA: hypothetical protein VI583_03465 [Cyclobacteriaceae bacterium]|nr:hypothetical protein [Cyclobacteriaceae bacterium]
MHLLLVLLFQFPPVAFLVPEWFDPEVDKTKVSRIESGGIVLYAENLSVNGRHMIFDIEIINNTEQAVEFDCGAMFYIATDIPFPTGEDMARVREFEGGLARHFPLSEGEVINHLRNEVKSRRTVNLLLGLVSMGLVIYDAANDAKDIHSEWSHSKARASYRRDLVVGAGLAAADAMQYVNRTESLEKRADIHYLGQDILRSGKLAPGQSVRGVIYFESVSNKFTRLIIPVGNTDYSFDFRQASWEDMKSLQSLR